MKPRDLARYLSDLGWRDPINLPDEQPSSVSSPQAGPEPEKGTDLEPGNLEGLARFLDGCTRCRLSEKRNHVVFGEGGDRSRVMFVGEGPGAEEDRTGRPFVGQAGKLLDPMILAMGLDRDQVYIANVVKCRAPGNRDPKDDEIAACSPFLDRQIEFIQDRLIAPPWSLAVGLILILGPRLLVLLSCRWGRLPARALRTPKGREPQDDHQ